MGVNSACLTPDLMKDPESLRKVVPLYFYLTRNKGRRLPVSSLKKVIQVWFRLDQKSQQIDRGEKASRHSGPQTYQTDQKRQKLHQNRRLHHTKQRWSVQHGTCALCRHKPCFCQQNRHDLKYVYKPRLHASFLNERQVQSRLLFCRNHQHDDWSRTLFTDESRFATSPDCPIMWWVKKGDKIYASKAKFPFSMMVWGGIVGSTKTPLIKCPKTLNAKSYVEMLESNGIVDFVQKGETSFSNKRVPVVTLP